MEPVIGVIVWGGLLWLAIVWLSRPPRGAQATSRHPPPPRPPSSPPPGLGATSPPQPLPPRPGLRDETHLEDEALVDGLVIGYHLARRHHDQRVAELREELEALQAEVDPWLLDGGDITDDLVALEDALGEAELDADDTFGLDPWDEGFGAGDDDP